MSRSRYSVHKVGEEKYIAFDRMPGKHVGPVESEAMALARIDAFMRRDEAVARMRRAATVEMPALRPPVKP